MTTIAVIGGTGYAGAAIVAEAASRGLTVRSLSRTAPAEPVEGVEVVTGSALDPAAVAETVAGADVVIGSLSPRGELVGRLAEAYAIAVEAAKAVGARFIMVGGFSTLRPAPGEPRFSEGDGIPEAYRGEALEVAAILPTLEASDVDWLFVSPAQSYGAYAPGERLGRYRVSGDVAVFDEHGKSEISGADFGLGVVDLAVGDEHHREHVSLSY
jgi:putative NADH-flavin reductase